MEKNYYHFKHTGILIINSGCTFNIKNLRVFYDMEEEKKKSCKLTLSEKLILASAKYFQFKPYAKD